MENETNLAFPSLLHINWTSGADYVGARGPKPPQKWFCGGRAPTDILVIYQIMYRYTSTTRIYMHRYNGNCRSGPPPQKFFKVGAFVSRYIVFKCYVIYCRSHASKNSFWSVLVSPFPWKTICNCWSCLHCTIYSMYVEIFMFRAYMHPFKMLWITSMTVWSNFINEYLLLKWALWFVADVMTRFCYT